MILLEWRLGHQPAVAMPTVVLSVVANRAQALPYAYMRTGRIRENFADAVQSRWGSTCGQSVIQVLQGGS
ncbi:MAG: hypothetical protein E5W39_01930 [Mesorhizobium sp.]|uniref:Uncharacterized protein n=1 Tax=Mesorhizobium wenxiniae TaxID=2014805 RepID=A0A271KH47_9HYPH|nr:hypothetical protein CIT31_13495 [Mesorhizobium wenxiniae]TIU09882.1 MAG: hypothetical protein E5W39_01930 [Mesorhizobium sp.]